jgi:O-antigen/teichoic acid export membrane protein
MTSPTNRTSRLRRLGGFTRAVDWRFIKSSSIISLGLAAARVIGFAFTFLLARAFSAEDYGYVQYNITLGTIVTIATMPFAQHVLPYFISRSKGNDAQLKGVMSNGWLVLLLLYVGTLVIALPLLAWAGRLNIGVIVIATGLTLFAIYSGLARGFMTSGRMLVMYLSSNLLQMGAVFLAIRVLGADALMPALVIYGLSYIPPILVLLIARPFPISFRLMGIQWAGIREQLRFAAPNWASHALFTLFFAMDILLLERFHDEATVGIYSLTKTIVLVFSFFPQGITMFLMPKVAEGGVNDNRRILINSLAINLIISAAMLAVYALTYQWFIVNFIGEVYFVGMDFALLMAASAVIFGVHAIVTSFLVGRNQPGLETISRIVITLITAAAGFALIPPLGLMGAAWTSLISAAAGILTYPMLMYTRRQTRQ